MYPNVSILYWIDSGCFSLQMHPNTRIIYIIYTYYASFLYRGQVQATNSLDLYAHVQPEYANLRDGQDRHCHQPVLDAKEVWLMAHTTGASCVRRTEKGVWADTEDLLGWKLKMLEVASHKGAQVLKDIRYCFFSPRFPIWSEAFAGSTSIVSESVWLFLSHTHTCVVCASSDGAQFLVRHPSYRIPAHWSLNWPVGGIENTLGGAKSSLAPFGNVPNIDA